MELEECGKLSDGRQRQANRQMIIWEWEKGQGNKGKYGKIRIQGSEHSPAAASPNQPSFQRELWEGDFPCMAADSAKGT